MKRVNNMLWGLVFVILGGIFGLNALEITNINVFFDGWWTLFIIVPSFIGLFNDDDKTGNLIFLVIGLCLLLGCQDIVSFDLVGKLIFPIILILIGLSFIFRDTVNSKVKKEMKKISKNTVDSKEYCATFGEQKLDFSGEKFEGCSLNAVFGGVKCDLRDAKLNEDIVINASSIFGGITIYVPDDAEVRITSTPIFGGVSNHHKPKTDVEKRTKIYVNTVCLFGGVEIR